MEQIGANKCFAGQQLRYRHESSTLQCTMNFSVYLPPGASPDKPVPALYWLSGLTCTDQNFVEKAGAQQYAAEHNIALIAPDTSPRGEQVPDDPEGAWDFGLGAGFYVDAVQEPWRNHYQMYSYITEELPALVESNLPVTTAKAISGHSMGGHGAITIALRNPNSYTSVSAFAPVAAPTECPWGKKALSRFLGGDQKAWQQYDSCALIAKAEQHQPLLVDQGGDDTFLTEQLMPERLQQTCAEHSYPLNFRLQEGYDHSYFFVATFIGDHIAYHAKHLHVKSAS